MLAATRWSSPSTPRRPGVHASRLRRQLHRRRDLSHRRQPGRQCQLHRGTPGPADLTVSKGAQTITFTRPPSAAVGGALHPDGHRRRLGQPGDLHHRRRRRLGCTSRAPPSPTPAGNCVIDANQAGNANYNAAPQVQQTIDRRQGRPDHHLHLDPASPAVGWHLHVSATGGGSGNPVTFSIDVVDDRQRAPSGATLNFTAAGPASSTPTRPATPTTTPPPRSSSPSSSARRPGHHLQLDRRPARVGRSHLHPAATGGASGNPVTFSIDPSAGAAPSSGATVTFTGAGTCVIDANQAGNTNYIAAPQVQQSITVVKAPRPSPSRRHRPAHVVGGPTRSRPPVGLGNPVIFTIDTSTAACAPSPARPSPSPRAGTCVIDANQAGNTNYNAAPQVQQSFIIAGTQAITFTSTPPAPRASVEPTRRGDRGASGNPVIFSIDSCGRRTGTISGGTINFTAGGSGDRRQPGRKHHLLRRRRRSRSRSRSSASIASQVVTFTSTPPGTSDGLGRQLHGDGRAVALVGQAGAVLGRFVPDGTSGACSISGATVSFTGGGELRDRRQPGRQRQL